MAAYPIYKEIMDTLRMMPNRTGQELMDALPHIKRSTMYSALSTLRNNDSIIVSGRDPQFLGADGEPTKMINRYSATDTPFPKRKPPKRHGYKGIANALKEQVAELQRWKANAIKQYPDLAVPPSVLKARKIAADEVATAGDSALADQIRRGDQDNSLVMRVTVKALEGK